MNQTQAFKISTDLWFDTKKATLWGRSFDLKGNQQSRQDAIDWWVEQLFDFQQFIHNVSHDEDTDLQAVPDEEEE